MTPASTAGASGDSEPGPPGDPAAPRLQRLREAMAKEGTEEERAVLLVRHPPNIRYLTGFTGSSAALLVGPDRTLLLTDARYRVQAAEETSGDVEVEITDNGLRDAVSGHLGDRGSGRVLFEADHVTVAELEQLREKAAPVEWVPVTGCVERLRTQKEPEEVEAIEAAAELAEEVLRDLLAETSEGVSERELSAELDYRLRRAGSEGSPFETIVASGPRTALPHARPSDRPLRRGDLLLVDFGAVRSGYCCDITRNFVLGPARDWQSELHAAVRGAQEAALDAVSPGVEAASVDRAARQVLEEAGLGDAFAHSTGHGLGLEVHEEPRLHRTSEQVLQAGQVVTVEPGAYLEGRGGVRIEDDVVVVPEGRRVLTKFSRALVQL